MALLRSVAPPDALAAAHRSKTLRDVDQRATEAFDRRVTQLEREHHEFRHRLMLVERAIRWLPSEQRDGARARLSALDTTADLKPFRLLRLTADGHERQATPSNGHRGRGSAAIDQRRQQVKQLHAQGLHATAIAERLGASRDQVRHDLKAMHNALSIAA